MTVKINCPECAASLRVGAAPPGTKIRCPKCRRVFVQPDEEPALAEPAEDVENGDEAITARPSAKRRVVDQVEEVEEADEVAEVDDQDVPRRRKTQSRWHPCPKCGSSNIQKVIWTVWGSFYGPALLSHVRCVDCGYTYNGRTGRSNIVAATLFVSVPLLGVLAILGWIGWRLYKTYVLMID
ncbi:MAG: zinc-ribbon domain-containing protein [Gemmataceae bacterium]|nr:zinc-ribbon domain-containing protein [Gemmataceae bacterium]